MKISIIYRYLNRIKYKIIDKNPLERKNSKIET